MSADNRWLYSGSNDATIKIWRLADYICTATLSGHTHYITTLALSSDNRWLYSGSYDATIKVWRLVDRTCTGTTTLTSRVDWILALVLSADDQWLYAGCGHQIKIQRLPTWQVWHETRHDRLSAEQAQRVAALLRNQDLYYDDLRHVIRACSALWLSV